MTFVIAEAGVNHNGGMVRARNLVDAAEAACADAVKFQAFTAARLDPPGKRRDMIRSLELSRLDLLSLSIYAEQVGIEFMVTPFDADWCRWCADNLPLKRIKIASGCLWDHELLAAARATGLPIILSTGLTTEQELLEAVVALDGCDLTLMHCVSRYPTAPAEINLLRMTKLAILFQHWNVKVGLSDHSLLTWPAAVAVTLGATVIEKHLTLDRDAEGPDHASSLEPFEFQVMVEMIRALPGVLGTGGMWQDAGYASQVKAERVAWRQSAA